MTSTILTSSAQSDAVSLTDKEKAFLKLCLNYDNVETQISDNFSNSGINEAMDLFEGSAASRRKAAGGLLTSLQKKGMGQLWTDNDQFQLSHRGIRAAFEA